MADEDEDREGENRETEVEGEDREGENRETEVEGEDREGGADSEEDRESLAAQEDDEEQSEQAERREVEIEGDSIDPEQARMLIGQGEARVLDLRSDEEVAAAHMPGAISADPDDLAAAIDRATRENAELTMIVVSTDDERSEEVASKLRDEGHQAVVLEGGFDAWVGGGHRTQPQTPEYEGPELKHPGAATATDPEELEALKEEDDDEGGDEGKSDEDDEGESEGPPSG